MIELFDVYRENFAFISPYIFCFISDSYIHMLNKLCC